MVVLVLHVVIIAMFVHVWRSCTHVDFLRGVMLKLILMHLLVLIIAIVIVVLKRILMHVLVLIIATVIVVLKRILMHVLELINATVIVVLVILMYVFVLIIATVIVVLVIMMYVLMLINVMLIMMYPIFDNLVIVWVDNSLIFRIEGTREERLLAQSLISQLDGIAQRAKDGNADDNPLHHGNIAVYNDK